MGKGDIRTKRGKIFRGTYGNRRRKKRRKKAADAAKQAKGTTPDR
jgi:ribosomal small subunit protein bTHX